MVAQDVQVGEGGVAREMGVGRAYPFVACLSCLKIEHAYFSRRRRGWGVGRGGEGEQGRRKRGRW